MITCSVVRHNRHVHLARAWMDPVISMFLNMAICCTDLITHPLAHARTHAHSQIPLRDVNAKTTDIEMVMRLEEKDHRI